MHVGDTIGVVASLGVPYRMRPVKFRWSGRLFEVKDVTHVWKSKEGQREICHFSVTDGRTLYELTFDTGSLLWTVENLEAYQCTVLNTSLH